MDKPHVVTRIFLALFWLLLWFLAGLIPVGGRASALSTLGTPPPDFVLQIDGGFTNSSRHVSVPAWPPDTIGVLLAVDHETIIRFGWETDGAGLAFWQTDAWISSGWSLRAGSTRLAYARVSQFAHVGGPCVPFDGFLDWAGYSGGSVYVVRETSGAAEFTIAQVGLGLWLDTEARSAWSTSIVVFGFGFGRTWWLNEVRWRAGIRGWWILPPPLPPPAL